MSMLGVKGQWVLDMSEPLDDIHPLNLISFKMISEAGNSLPTCEVIFNLKDKQKIHDFSQNKSIRIGIGRDGISFVGNFTLFKREKLHENDQWITLRVLLVHSSVGYAMETKTRIIESNSKEFISSISRESGLKFESNIRTSNDKMNWIQSNISNRMMVNKLWLHSKLENPVDIAMVGITPDSKLLFHSLEKVKAGIGINKWSFVPAVSKAQKDFNPAVYLIPIIYKSNTGAVDYLGGYSQSRLVHNTDNKQANMMTATASPTLAQTSKDESINSASRFSTVSYQSNDNMHQDWYKRKDFNIRALAKMNSHIAKVVLHDSFQSMQILDLAYLYDNSTDTNGYWIIKKICHKVINNQYSCIVTLCRDNPNEVKNDRSI